MRGDAHALETLIRSLTPDILRIARRLVCDAARAEDLVTETLDRGAVKLKKLRDPARAEAWFRSILVHLWRDDLRRKAQPEVSLDDAAEPMAPAGCDPSLEADLEELRGIVDKEVASLPPVQRAVIALSLEEGLGVAEIAEALGTSADRVKASLWHARRKLRERLSRLVGEGD